MNYNEKMREQISNITSNNRLLLHVCCAPCSSAVLERLKGVFLITILYYNPNIEDESEYNKRLNELKRFLKQVNLDKDVNVIDGGYDPKVFHDKIKGVEDTKERGERCFRCYRLRLEKTANMASEMGFDYFATSLTLSPYKNSIWLNEIGEELSKSYKSTYLYSDFKKENGYKRSIELSNKYNLYRQDYCGCVYSKIEREKNKANKFVKGDI